MAEGGGLLNRYRLVKAYRGFESLRLRHRIIVRPGDICPAENSCTGEKPLGGPEGSGPSQRPGEGQDDNLVLKVLEQPVGDQADGRRSGPPEPRRQAGCVAESKTCWTAPRRRSCVTAFAVNPRGVTGKSCRRSRLQQTS